MTALRWAYLLTFPYCLLRKLWLYGPWDALPFKHVVNANLSRPWTKLILHNTFRVGVIRFTSEARTTIRVIVNHGGFGGSLTHYIEFESDPILYSGEARVQR